MTRQQEPKQFTGKVKEKLLTTVCSRAVGDPGVAKPFDSTGQQQTDWDGFFCLDDH